MDLFQKIYESKNQTDLALNIRQWAMSIVIEMRQANCYNNPLAILDKICEYEKLSRIVLQSESMDMAWSSLKKHGF